MLKLEQIRKSRGITQTYLAKKLGYKYTSGYSNIEKGRTKLEVSQAKVLADIFGVKIEELFDDEKNFENNLDKKSNSA